MFPYVWTLDFNDAVESQITGGSGPGSQSLKMPFLGGDERGNVWL